MTEPRATTDLGFRRILVGYDGSFGAHAALRFALTLADADDGARVTAVATVPLFNTVATVGEIGPGQPIERPEVLDWLVAAATYAAEAGHRIATAIWAGPVGVALAAAAADRDADLVVIGAPAARRRWRRSSRTVGALMKRFDHPIMVISR